MNSVSAVEDLMKEHGILNRLLLIYEKIIDMIDKNEYVNKKYILLSSLLVRHFVENYHEKTEELYVFPKVRHINKNLIDQLIKQHRQSNLITNNIIKLASNNSDNIEELEKLREYLKTFVYMYRYHETREDTEVFVWFKNSLTKIEYEKMSELFEKEEDEILGKNGFEKILNIIKFIEQKLNIYELEYISNDVDYILNKNNIII